MSFISFSWLSAASRSMQNRSGERWQSVLVSYLRGKEGSLSPLNRMLAVDFCKRALYWVRGPPCYPCLLEFFIVNGYWILSNTFLALIDMHVWFYIFSLVIWCIYIDSQMLNLPCLSEMKLSHLLWLNFVYLYFLYIVGFERLIFCWGILIA